MKQKIDQLLSTKVAEGGPGVALAVVQQGEVVYKNCLGLANLEWNIPIQSDTVFRLASITKQFTAVAMMMLQAQGKIHVDDPLTKFLPDYPTQGRDIRIHHLLTHTSGIKSYTSMEGWFPDKIILDMSPQAVCDEFAQQPFDFEPGERYLYNNSGYHLLGMIIEQITEMEYAQFIEDQIFKPLGMNSSTYLNNEPVIPNRASGYHPLPDGYRNAPYMSMTQPYAAGGLGSSLDDLLLWEQSLRDCALVSQEVLEQMWTPVVLNDGTTETYGYGWEISTYHDHRIIHHGGGIPGFSTFMLRFPDDDIGIYLLSNLASFDSMGTILSLLPITLGVQATPREAINLPVEKLKKLAGLYRMEEGWAVNIHCEDDQLIFEGITRRKLLAIDETHFYPEDQVETDVTFQIDDAGLVASLKFETALMSFIGKRVEAENGENQ